MPSLLDFVRESNHIEGITETAAHAAHLLALEQLLEVSFVSIEDLQQFVRTVQPDAQLRDRPGMNVYIKADDSFNQRPEGGPELVQRLQVIVRETARNQLTPFEAHTAYENLHPFTDCNGRSGRALWLWQMVHFSMEWEAAYHGAWGLSRSRRHTLPMPFLREFYYQTLEAMDSELDD